jgi:putative transposase
MVLEKAFGSFVRNPKHFGFPKHKKKHRYSDSYTTNLIVGNIRLREDGKLKLPKLGPVHTVQHRGRYRMCSLCGCLPASRRPKA